MEYNSAYVDTVGKLFELLSSLDLNEELEIGLWTGENPPSSKVKHFPIRFKPEDDDGDDIYISGAYVDQDTLELVLVQEQEGE